ncbi:unnamed protein product [Fusarium fujikuroi]|nr:unnamed protein product [Fusarium fujikuroi]
MKYSISLIALFAAGALAIPAATTPKCKAVSICTPRPCTKQCVPGCFCKEGTIRSQSGSCVSRNKC